MAVMSTATANAIRPRVTRDGSSRVKSLVHAMPNGVVLLDARGYVREVNDEAIRLLGEPLEGTLWRKVIARAFRPQHDDGHEVSLKSGRRVRLDISSLSPEPGQLIVLTDMSETRALQARISHLQRLTAMGRMVASLAHQIRTPLSAALLYADNLAHKNLPASQQEKFLGKLKDRLKDLEQQVNDMLLYAKSGSQQPVQRIVMGDLIAKLESQVAAALEQHEVSLEVLLRCPEALVVGNQSALLGALQNLLINAAQASEPNAPVRLTVGRNESDILIDIEDQGKGIAESEIEQIFTPFFTNKTHGTGLGLAVVKAVVSAHHGTIEVESTVGKGTLFRLRIPTADSFAAGAVKKEAEVKLKEKSYDA